VVNDKKIYVSIASYRDPFLQRTIDSLYCTADRPLNITVGCFVHAFTHDLETCTPVNRDGYKVFYDVEAPGSVFSVTACRNRCLKWLDDSYDYVLQVDAHTAFDNGWDTYLIDFIEGTGCKNPILSGALSSFGVYKDGTEIRDYVSAAKTFYLDPVDTKRAYINASDLAPNGTIVEPISGKPYAHGWYIAGHFIFAPTLYFKSIPQPEWVLFWGEEVINSVRAFTAGWDVFIPKDIPLYHLDENLTRTGRPRLWEDFPDGFFSRRDYTGNRIIDILLGNPHEESDMFYKRSLADLYTHIGTDLGALLEGWRKEKYGK
jgi:hypothetical protein